MSSINNIGSMSGNASTQSLEGANKHHHGHHHKAKDSADTVSSATRQKPGTYTPSKEGLEALKNMASSNGQKLETGKSPESNSKTK